MLYTIGLITGITERHPKLEVMYVHEIQAPSLDEAKKIWPEKVSPFARNVLRDFGSLVQIVTKAAHDEAREEHAKLLRLAYRLYRPLSNLNAHLFACTTCFSPIGSTPEEHHDGCAINEAKEIFDHE